ncbi:hypothetical protein ERJ75_000676900 [Trypanosoma vivax]|uniref:Uncharacterized protein n=1 Tax=Trypanosoma vivax (strain Y486) TaxID=1055687 RepID=F9WUP6_TRYVY
MEDVASFSALVNRSSPATQRRMFVVLHGLVALTKKSGVKLSVQSLVVALEFSMLQTPVRFLFASGSNAVLRSHDRGSSWRTVYSACAGNPTERSMDHSPEDIANAVEDSVKLLSGTYSKPLEKVALFSDAEIKIHYTVAMGDMLAACGHNLFLAVSIDRGLTFSIMERTLLLPSVKSDSDEEHNLLIGGAAFLSRTALLIFCKKKLFVVELHQESYRSVSFSGVKLLKAFPAPIGCMRTFPQICDSDICELFLSISGMLYYSSDGGYSFISFPHRLGILRALEPLDLKVRCRETPPIPRELLIAMTTPPEKLSCKSKGGKFEYKVICRDGDSAKSFEELCKREMCEKSRSLAGLPYNSEGVCYRVLIVAGVGAPILPYDFTSLLFIAASSAGGSPTVGTLAERVEYIPYMKSGSTGPLSIAVSRCSVARGCVFARGNAAGVSFSTDMGKSWSVPKQAYVIETLAADGGGFICCSRRNVASTTSNGNSNVYSIPTDLRVPFLTSATVML